VHEQLAVPRILDDNGVGIGKNLDGSHCQQPGISRARTDEGDAAH
jgi:hypothetical protein